MQSLQRQIIEEDLENVFGRDIPWNKLKDKTVLITGAYGMLASYLIYMLIYLNERNDSNIEIIALGRSRIKFENRFGEFANCKYMKFIESDLTAPLDIEDNIDYIIHAASFASPQYYRTNPIEVLMPNTVGNYYLLELASKKKVDAYVLFSSGDIYGSLNGVDVITEDDCGVLNTLDIHSCYGESKRMAETMCKAWFIEKNVPVKILRIAHTYSPTMDLYNDPRVFSSFVKDIVNNHDIVMKSDGSGKRSFCYIADAIAGYFLVVLSGKAGEAYNVANTDEFYSIAELAEILTSLCPERKLKVIRKKRAPDDCYVESTTASGITLDNSKLKSLGWDPRYSVKTGFKRVIDYFT